MSSGQSKEEEVKDEVDLPPCDVLPHGVGNVRFRPPDTRGIG